MQPYSNACENNKVPILTILQSVLSDVSSVLEIGSGTAQHAVYFAPLMPHLTWQTSDVIDNHPGIMSWLDALPASNLLAPLELDLREDWQIAQYDAVFTSNTLHIIESTLVVAFFN